MVHLDQIINFFENSYADIRTQLSWDFSGSQIYLGDCAISKVCISLDPSKDVVQQAIDERCGLLITHHPLFFTPQKGINAKNTRDAIVINAIQNRLNIISYHTNLDMATDGTNRYLLRLLNAKDAGYIEQEGSHPLVKINVFAPHNYADKIVDAIDNAGGGKIGNYKRCAFTSEGIGTFTPLQGSSPFIGKTDVAESVNEVKIESVVPKRLAQKVVAAVKAAHPYEEAAVDVYDIESPLKYGSGNIGVFESPITMQQLISSLKKILGINNVRSNMTADQINKQFGTVSKFGIVSGSGASMWKATQSRGVDILITGDMKHHDAIDARDAGLLVLDIGHYQSERIYMEYLANVVKERFDVDVFVAEESPSISDI